VGGTGQDLWKKKKFRIESTTINKGETLLNPDKLALSRVCSVLKFSALFNRRRHGMLRTNT